MVPLQYIVQTRHLEAALSSGCCWIQTIDPPTALDLKRAHDAGCYLFITDDVEACKTIAADGVLLTKAKVQQLTDQLPEPSGIVLQRPLPITLAIGEARRMLGEESPQMVGVSVDTANDAVAAAKAGADFIQVPRQDAPALTAAVRARHFTTPIVALGVTTAEETAALLDQGISGIACTMDSVPPLLIPSLLKADEQ